MFKLTFFFAFTATLLTAVSAFAVPGGNHMTCDSKPGAKQTLHLEVGRSVSSGNFAPDVKIAVNGKSYAIDTSDIQKQYGESIHDAALGVIVVTVNNFEEDGAKTMLSAQVMAVPGSVKAYDQQGKLVKWNLTNDDGGECIDGYGKATFQGVLTGNLQQFSGSPSTESDVEIDNQILDCTMTYDTGSAC